MNKTILVVDDSAMICHVVSQILQEAGYKVVTAKNGKEGCDMALRHNPQLIIMDVEMPVMDGIQATAKIKSTPFLSLFLLHWEGKTILNAREKPAARVF